MDSNRISLSIWPLSNRRRNRSPGRRMGRPGRWRRRRRAPCRSRRPRACGKAADPTKRGLRLVKGFRTFACCLALLAAPLACYAQQAVHQAASITPNFKDADITQIVQAVAAATGKSFILDPRVRAQVTMYSSAPMSPPAFYQAFLSILEVYGFIAMPSGNNIVKIVPDADTRYVPANYLGAHVNGASDEIVTQVVAVKNVSAAELVPILRPMIPQQGHLAAYPPSNILIISDTASNVRRMMAIIDRIDRIGNQDVDV